MKTIHGVTEPITAAAGVAPISTPSDWLTISAIWNQLRNCSLAELEAAANALGVGATINGERRFSPEDAERIRARLARR